MNNVTQYDFQKNESLKDDIELSEYHASKAPHSTKKKDVLLWYLQQIKAEQIKGEYGKSFRIRYGNQFADASVTDTQMLLELEMVAFELKKLGYNTHVRIEKLNIEEERVNTEITYATMTYTLTVTW